MKLYPTPAKKSAIPPPANPCLSELNKECLYSAFQALREAIAYLESVRDDRQVIMDARAITGAATVHVSLAVEQLALLVPERNRRALDRYVRRNDPVTEGHIRRNLGLMSEPQKELLLKMQEALMKGEITPESFSREEISY